MRLKTGVQMDPIERINIRGNSTFAILLEAQARGHGIFYYTPDKLFMRDGRVFAEGSELRVADAQGAHFELGSDRRWRSRNWTSSISGRIRPSIWLTSPRRTFLITSIRKHLS